MVHDHVLNLDTRCFLRNDVLTFVRHLLMTDKTISINDVLSNTNSEFNLRLKHLDILNAYRHVKGESEVDVSSLTADL